MQQKQLREDIEMRVWGRKSVWAAWNVLAVSIARRMRLQTVHGLPFVLFREPTTLCQLSCPSCPTGTGRTYLAPKKVRLEDFCSTIDMLKNELYLVSLYSLGEPLLHRDFSAMVKYAVDNGVVVRAGSTLSMHLSDRQCRDIGASGLHFLQVGVAGTTQASHEVYRRGALLSTVHANLRKLVVAKKRCLSNTPVISVDMHVFAHNEHEVESFKSQMKSLEVDEWQAISAWLPPDDLVVGKPRDAMYDRYLEINKILGEWRRMPMQIRPCSWLFYTATINPNNKLSPCCGMISDCSSMGSLEFGSHVTGRQLKKNFRTIWNSALYRVARSLFSTKNIASWSSECLEPQYPNGMAFAARGVPPLCLECPIPYSIGDWSDLVRRIEKSNRLLLAVSLRSWRLSVVIGCATRAILFRIAAWSQ